MRFTRLSLVKFGMFTDTELDLLPEGVNVIVGANEAGKTTTMAAIRQLLYGIPTRSPHSYLHSNSDLRIGATLVANDGRELEMFRVKRNSAALISSSNQAISDETMSELLGGVGSDTYETIFSISHEEIVSGGEALLRGEGELGRALLAAGTGLTQLNSTMAKINARVGELFKPGASKPLINEGIARYKGSKSAIREHSQSALAAEEVEVKLAKAEELDQKLGSDYNALNVELNRSVRVRQVRAPMEHRRSMKKELAELSEEGPRVPATIGGKLIQAQETRREGNSSLATLRPDLNGLDEKLSELVVDEMLVEQAPEVERLVEELGAIRQNMKDLPGLNKKVGDLDRRLKMLLHRVPEGCKKDSMGIPELSDVERSRIERLSDEWIRIQGSLSKSLSAREDARRLHDRNLAESTRLPGAIDVSNLRSAVTRIRGEGQLESTLDDLNKQVADSLGRAEAVLASLRVNIEARDADMVALPSVGRVNEVDKMVVETKSSYAAALGEEDRNKTELAALNEQLEQHILLTDPPSLEDLAAARTMRDEGWKIVKGIWLDDSTTQAQAETWSEGRPLDRAFEDAMKEADEIADRLRHEAEAVERQLSLKAQVAAKVEITQTNHAALEAASKQHSDALEQWRKLWEPVGVEAASRPLMDEFLVAMRDIAVEAAKIKDLENRAASLQASIERSKVDLRFLLHEANDEPEESLSLMALLARAEQICNSSDEAREKRLLMDQTLESSRSSVEAQQYALETAEKERDSWNLQWSEAVVPLGIPALTSPTDVADLLLTIQEIEDTSLELDEQRLRVSGIERRNQEVANQLGDVLQALPHLAIDAFGTEIAINTLQGKLKIAQSAMTTRKALLEQREEKATKVDKVTSSVTQAEALITELVGEFDFVDEPSLVRAIERTNRMAELENKIHEIEDELIAAHGVSMDQLAREVESYSDVDIDGKIEQLNLQRDAYEGELKELALEIGGLRALKKSINDSDEAAFEAERAQIILSEVGNYTDEYVRLTLAKHLLEQQISDYRSQNQGPILLRASEIFARVTIGKYAGIETDIDDKNRLVILAKASNGNSLGVGTLSTGTRDQLYLSLRLAALENYAVGTRNLPLLLDDLFVHFDDERTKAGLAVIEEMCSRLQVILFTHHGQVVNQARDTISNGRLRVQVLAH
ncbi:MAG: AAA family ATPase [Acidimicrobiaceae bacterium]|nr:AAA family ATPase [Acidimicrobiaceae bacterium]